MKAIFKLLILNFLTLFIFPSCSDDDKSKSELNDPISGNISPVGSFAVEATNNENELLVKWTNPSNRDVPFVSVDIAVMPVQILCMWSMVCVRKTSVTSIRMILRVWRC